MGRLWGGGEDDKDDEGDHQREVWPGRGCLRTSRLGKEALLPVGEEGSSIADPPAGRHT